MAEREAMGVKVIDGWRFIEPPSIPVYQTHSRPYLKGKSGARFRGAHLRLRPIQKLTRSKKTGYITNARSK